MILLECHESPAPQRAHQRLPSTALGGRSNSGVPQRAREDSRWSRASCQILPGLGKVCLFAVGFVPPTRGSQRHDGSCGCVFVEFVTSPLAIYNYFLGFFLDFTSIGVVENCIATTCWFHNYNIIFIFSTLFGWCRIYNCGFFSIFLGFQSFWSWFFFVCFVSWCWSHLLLLVLCLHASTSPGHCGLGIG